MKYQPDAYGFFEVTVTCPDHISEPELQKRHDTGQGLRTISPTGTWRYWYYSEELKNVEKLGYTYTVLRGYLFDKEEIFTQYVEYLYKIKSATLTKATPLYHIPKLLLNSLFGKFGMNLLVYANKQLFVDEAGLLSLVNSSLIFDIEAIDI